MRRLKVPSLLALFCFALAATAMADDTTSSAKPVSAVADHTLKVITAKGTGLLPLYVSADWSKPLPEVTRVLIIFHGKLRNADTYNASGLAAIKAAGAAGKGTMLITPQFLAQVDIDQYKLQPGILRWAPEGWMGGDDAIGQPISSFDAIDAILVQLSDRKMFPNLKNVVLAGHSGGGQVMQRYAVVGRGGEKLMSAGVHVRYIVANPSSYVYFSPERPVLNAKGSFTFDLPQKSCYGKYDKWKFGINDPVPYIAGGDFKELEQRFVRRDVIYLLGTNDTDPNHPALDKSCAAEDEGPYRFFRGKAYFAYMLGRHPELANAGATQQLWFVPGVEHDGDKMFNSPCGLAAIFGAGTCTTRVTAPKP